MASSHTIGQLIPLITLNRGARFEADIFDLLLDYAHVVRSFEFAPADGAVCCSIHSTLHGTYSDRFWQIDEMDNETYHDHRQTPTSPHHALCLSPFDVKSNTALKAEGQVYVTTIRQRKIVAFYIGICAADPSFVELIPNYYTGLPIQQGDDPSRYVAVNLSRKSLTGPGAYKFLSPCNAAYRMPTSLLHEAISRVRACVQACGQASSPPRPYVNPWTGAKFSKWDPVPVHTNEVLLPSDETQHGSGYAGIMEIWKAVRVAHAEERTPMRFEFVSVQPRLADFKLLVPYEPARDISRQVFVQYKIDSVDRAYDNKNIVIGRNDKHGAFRWYFTDTERFDFLWYEFRYKNRTTTGVPTREFYFVPERCLPDQYYTSLDIHARFDFEEHSAFRVPMGMEGDWVKRVYAIICAYPEPRALSRTYRPAQKHHNRPALHLQHQAETQDLSFPNKFFMTIMKQCALNGRGLLIVLARQHPMADYAYCRYTWTPRERQAFLERGVPPATISDLPAAASVILVHIYTKSKAMTSRGPSFSPPEFVRLDGCRVNRLLIFDMLGAEGSDIFGPLTVVPSDDVSVSSGERAFYIENLRKDKKQFSDRVPLLAQQIHTAYIIPDYTLSASGPMILEEATSNTQWTGVWLLLHKFSGVDEFTFPHACPRLPARYRVTVQQLHQSLADFHASIEDDALMLSEAAKGSSGGDDEDDNV